MWLHPNSPAIRRTPHPNAFSRSIAATSSGVCIASLHGNSPREAGCTDSPICLTLLLSEGVQFLMSPGVQFYLSPDSGWPRARKRTTFAAGWFRVGGSVKPATPSGQSGNWHGAAALFGTTVAGEPHKLDLGSNLGAVERTDQVGDNVRGSVIDGCEPAIRSIAVA